MVKGVLFDLDNTLCEETPPHKAGMEKLYDEMNVARSMSLDEFDLLYNEARQEVKREHYGTASAHNRLLYIQRLVEKTHRTVVPDLILRLYDAYWNTALSTLKLFPNTIETLAGLRKNNIVTGMITNLTTHVQLRKIHQLGLSDQIDFFVTSEEAGIEKPHPSIFLLTLNKMKVHVEDAIMVGDTAETDIEGANAAGIRSVLITNGDPVKYTDPKDVKTAKYVINTIDELPDLIAKL